MELWELIDPKALLIAALVFIPLERLMPYKREQKVLREQWASDLVYALVNKVIIRLGLIMIFAMVFSTLAGYMPRALPDAVASLPIWLQVIGVLFVADTGFYLAHRMFHAVPFLWRIHQIHHSIEEMDWLAAHRVHPIDQTITQACSLLPVFLLGFSGEAIVIFAVIYQWQSLLIHSNVHLPFGIFRWVLASPQYHHWHHGNQREAYDKNFAGQLPIIDVIFGTHHFPKDELPRKYGVDDPVPKSFLPQLLYPFTRNDAKDDAPTTKPSSPVATPGLKELKTNDVQN